MKPEVEQELAHVLLTELLAYQFASPVRWIETQDVILKDLNTERVVEVGPAPTLANMAQRTLKNKYESYDAALSLQRQVLCYSKDTREIYYTLDPAELQDSKSNETNTEDTSNVTQTQAQSQPQPQPQGDLRAGTPRKALVCNVDPEACHLSPQPHFG